MLDFWGPPPLWVQSASQPLADFLNLSSLPLHIHQILISYAFYQGLQSYVSPWLSNLLFPRVYSSLNPRTKLNWDIHVVSLVQAVVISVLSVYVQFWDEERFNMAPAERLYGYSPACLMIGALGAGYFIWDFMVCARWYKLFGVGMLAHAASALSVYCCGFRPFLNYYSPTFLLYEVSSPFLNIHWFCDKLGLTGSRLQWYNGMLLLSSFFSCRIVWGTWQSVRFHLDTYRAYMQRPEYAPLLLVNGTTDLARPNVEAGGLPLWLYGVFFVSNVTLNCLNWYWFEKMIDAVLKRFKPAKEQKEKEAAIEKAARDKRASLSEELVVEAASRLTDVAEVGGAVVIGEDEKEIRRRKM